MQPQTWRKLSDLTKSKLIKRSLVDLIVASHRSRLQIHQRFDDLSPHQHAEDHWLQLHLHNKHKGDSLFILVHLNDGEFFEDTDQRQIKDKVSLNYPAADLKSDRRRSARGRRGRASWFCRKGSRQTDEAVAGFISLF